MTHRLALLAQSVPLSARHEPLSQHWRLFVQRFSNFRVVTQDGWLKFPKKVFVMKMQLWTAFAAFAAVTAATLPAQADGLSPWGVWTDGSQIRRQKQQPSVLPSPNRLGRPGDFAVAPPKAKSSKSVELASGGGRPNIAVKSPTTVAFNSGYSQGEVIIDTSARKLYYMVSDTEAYAYPIAVGQVGFTWTGTEQVSKIVDWPDWVPPDEMRQRKPYLPIKMTGGVRNPLGAKAIYLGNTLYRIHGTNDQDSIGTASSSGCFRMHNGHVLHLAGLIGEGTKVHVLKSLPKAGKQQNLQAI